MSTPETPRTWTMRQTSEPGVGWLVDGQMPEPFEVVEVIEKAPVEVERERLLDLLEETLVGGLISEGVRRRVMVVLREYGRLGHRRPGT